MICCFQRSSVDSCASTLQLWWLRRSDQSVGCTKIFVVSGLASCFSSSFWSCMFPFAWALAGIWIQWPAASKAATVTNILYSCYGTHVPEKRQFAVPDLVFVLLLYVSSLHYVNMGATENSEIRHKTKINSRISAYGEKKNMRGYPNIFLQCSLQVCGGFIAATWDFNSPKETGNLVQEFQWKKKNSDSLGGFPMVNTSSAVTWVMSWPRGLMWWDILMPLLCVCVCYRE